MPFPDEWVLNSQIWLNSHYSGVNGFTEVDEDGLTGWQTCVRADQGSSA